MPMPQLRDIQNDTPANAIDVDWNFETIESYVANDVITRDGTTAMQAPLDLLGAPPSAPSHAVNVQYVNQSVVPVGIIWQFAGTAAPSGWAMCDGVVKSQTDPLYAALFAVIGSAFNTGGEGPGNFRLPDLRGRFPVGRHATDAVFDTLGERAGTKDATALLSHSHTVNNHTHDMQNHQHVVPAHGHGGSIVDAPNHQHWAAQAIDTFFAHGRLGDIAHQGAPPGSANTFADLHNLATDLAGAHGHGLVINNAAAVWTNQINNNTTTGATPGTSPTAIGTAANANLPPFIVVNFIIRIG